LKKDRGEYIKASDVNTLYQAVIKQGVSNRPTSVRARRRHPHSYVSPLVTKLNDVRQDDVTYNNRLDTLLADVFNLLSLFFLTIGKTREAPAAYSQLASMRVSLTPKLTRVLWLRAPVIVGVSSLAKTCWPDGAMPSTLLYGLLPGICISHSVNCHHFASVRHGMRKGS
jgi:hypothetical protein